MTPLVVLISMAAQRLWSQRLIIPQHLISMPSCASQHYRLRESPAGRAMGSWGVLWERQIDEWKRTRAASLSDAALHLAVAGIDPDTELRPLEQGAVVLILATWIG
jgi:hypothetical protein